MVIVSHDDVLSVDGVDDLGHVENLGFPVVLPTGFRPKQTLVPDPEHH